jgi:hypothetical protein
MKIIKTNNFMKSGKGDLNEFPPVNREKEQRPQKKDKKKKIYQWNMWVDDIAINDEQ